MDPSHNDKSQYNSVSSTAPCTALAWVRLLLTCPHVCMRQPLILLPICLQVSRQIRNEVLPMFYASSTFVFRCDRNSIDLTTAAQTWLLGAVIDHMKYLRTVIVSFEMKTRDSSSRQTRAEARLTFDPKYGLRISSLKNLSKVSRSKLDRITMNAQAAANYFRTNDQGGPMFTALTANPDVFQYGSLEWRTAQHG